MRNSLCLSLSLLASLILPLFAPLFFSFSVLSYIYICMWGIPRQTDQAETPLYLFYFFIQVCYRRPQKKTYTNFQIFLKISLAVLVEIVDLVLRVVIASFEIRTTNSLIKKKSGLISLQSHLLTLPLFTLPLPLILDRALPPPRPRRLGLRELFLSLFILPSMF